MVHTINGRAAALVIGVALLGAVVAIPQTSRAMESMSMSSGGSAMTSQSSIFASIAQVLQSILTTLGELKLKTDTPAVNLRVTLNALERQHVDLASAATRAGFDGRPEFSAVAGELDKNSVSIADAVGSIYGAGARDKFLEIWRSHITFFVNYTVAAKKGDQAGMAKAVQDLGGYEDAIADFFSGANPNLPREAVKQLVTEHVGLLKGAVDAYGAGDYAGSYAKQSAAYTQIGTIADALTGAIVKQNPSKF